MSIVKDLFEKLNYVSERKERDNVVSNEFKNVVVDALLLTTKAVEKGVMTAQSAIESAELVPVNIRAFANEHTQGFVDILKEFRTKISKYKLYETIDNEYQPDIRGKVKGIAA